MSSAMTTTHRDYRYITVSNPVLSPGLLITLHSVMNSYCCTRGGTKNFAFSEVSCLVVTWGRSNVHNYLLQAAARKTSNQILPI